MVFMLVIVTLVIVMRRWKVFLVVLLVLGAGVLQEGSFLKHTGGIVTEALLIHISYESQWVLLA
jgi:hypothetical protein